MASPDTELQPAYVRCRDLDGELWTIPRGSKLHLLLWSDVQQGYPEPFVPVELIREPWRGLDATATVLLEPLMEELFSPFSHPNKKQFLAQTAYRYGQFLRLQERVKVRTSTDA